MADPQRSRGAGRAASLRGPDRAAGATAAHRGAARRRNKGTDRSRVVDTSRTSRRRRATMVGLRARRLGPSVASSRARAVCRFIADFRPRYKSSSLGLVMHREDAERRTDTAHFLAPRVACTTRPLSKAIAWYDMCTDHMLPLITLITLTCMHFTIWLRGGTPA